MNGTPIRNKLDDAITLERAGVPTIKVSRQAPPQEVQQALPPDPIVAQWEELNEHYGRMPESIS